MLLECKHSFCGQCMKTYLQTQVLTNQHCGTPMCLQAACARSYTGPLTLSHARAGGTRSLPMAPWTQCVALSPPAAAPSARTPSKRCSAQASFRGGRRCSCSGRWIRCVFAAREPPARRRQRMPQQAARASGIFSLRACTALLGGRAVTWPSCASRCTVGCATCTTRWRTWRGARAVARSRPRAARSARSAPAACTCSAGRAATRTTREGECGCGCAACGCVVSCAC